MATEHDDDNDDAADADDEETFFGAQPAERTMPNAYTARGLHGTEAREMRSHNYAISASISSCPISPQLPLLPKSSKLLPPRAM